MYCTNCGCEIKDGAKFCTECGMSFTDGEVKKNCSESEESRIDVYFLPKKVFGQFLVRKATLEIDGKTLKTKFKKAVKLELAPGETEIFCYANYLGKSGKAMLTHNFEKGKTYLIKYHCPIIVFFAGKIEVTECHVNSKGIPVENK